MYWSLSESWNMVISLPWTSNSQLAGFWIQRFIPVASLPVLSFHSPTKSCTISFLGSEAFGLQNESRYWHLKVSRLKMTSHGTSQLPYTCEQVPPFSYLYTFILLILSLHRTMTDIIYLKSTGI